MRKTNNNNNNKTINNKVNRNININHKNQNGSRCFPFTNSYYISILFRFIVGTLAIGYIHPDEYFQSPEITSSFIFNYKTFIPWEFDSTNPCRSIVIPLFNSGIPFYILKSIQNLINLVFGSNSISIINSSTLIFVPRFFMVCLSLLLDYYMVIICKRFNLSYRKALSILSSCWLIAVFHSRTFSNTIESLLVATLLTLIITYRDSETGLVKINIFRDWLIGFTISCGIFSRFTFIFFSAPMGVYLFYLYLTRSKSIFTTIICVISIVCGFISTSCFFILIDSIYFKYLNIPFLLQDPLDIIYQISNSLYKNPLLLQPKESINNLLSNDPNYFLSLVKNNLTFTPINSFIYNIDPKNLAEHGIHNRLTHIFANLPLMVGPLIILLIIEILNINSLNNNNNNNNNSSNNSNSNSNTSNSNNGISNNHHKNNSNSNRKEVFPRSIRNLLLSVILSGIIFLSMAPHQEARFLLPIFFPLALLTYRYFYFNKKRSKALLIIWIIFNMCLTIFFGFIHQAGVTTSLSYLNSNIIKHHQNNNNNLVINNQLDNGDNSNNNLINNNLINNNLINSNISIVYYHTYMPPRYILGINKNNDKVNLYDTLGGDIGKLVNLVESLKNSKVYILAPTKTILYQQYKGKTCQLTESFWPHLTTEDMPSRLDELRLFMFECTDI